MLYANKRNKRGLFMHINSDTSTHEAFYTINNTVCRKYFSLRANNYLEEKRV